MNDEVSILLSKADCVLNAGAGGLPTQIPIPRLEAVALSIGNEASKKASTASIIMPTPSKGVTAAIGKAPATKPAGSESSESEAEKKPLRKGMDAAPSLTPQQTQFTPAEKKAFERAELKTQEACLQLVEKEANANGKAKISMVVIGHVDAGKSTITGHLLYNLGYVSQKLMHKYEKESREAGKSSFAYAWVMDADDEEVRAYLYSYLRCPLNSFVPAANTRRDDGCRNEFL